MHNRNIILLISSVFISVQSTFAMDEERKDGSLPESSFTTILRSSPKPIAKLPLGDSSELPKNSLGSAPKPIAPLFLRTSSGPSSKTNSQAFLKKSPVSSPRDNSESPPYAGLEEPLFSLEETIEQEESTGEQVKPKRKISKTLPKSQRRGSGSPRTKTPSSGSPKGTGFSEVHKGRSQSLSQGEKTKSPRENEAVVPISQLQLLPSLIDLRTALKEEKATSPGQDRRMRLEAEATEELRQILKGVSSSSQEEQKSPGSIAPSSLEEEKDARDGFTPPLRQRKESPRMLEDLPGRDGAISPIRERRGSQHSSSQEERG